MSLSIHFFQKNMFTMLDCIVMLHICSQCAVHQVSNFPKLWFFQESCEYACELDHKED